jgi:primosomal protein N'
MKIFTCPICENKIDLPDAIKPKERITCPNCFAQLALHNVNGKLILGCAICKEPQFDPANCGDCETRREKKKILTEGVL